jgi:hypothetical protein
MMKGLELAKAYYDHLGAPMLRERFPELFDRIAVGLIGPGSECFGFDDDISRDHDWGPAFCMWLTQDDYQKYGKELQKTYNELPKVFQGFGPRQSSPGEEFRTGVCPTETFYATYIGLNHPPTTIKEWTYIPDSSLAICTNGQVFSDKLGEFSRIRQALLEFYPEDVRLKKIASRCFTIAQSGQYNLPRSLKRRELFAANWALLEFCAETMSLLFLLNKRYAPFYKWMHRAIKELPLMGEWAHSTINDLMVPIDIKEKPTIVETACAVIIQELRSQDLTDSTSDFLLDHAHSVHSRIRDEEFRRRFMVIK